MKALKTLVIGMGLLIVIGIALVGIGLSRKGKPEQQVMVSPIVSGAPFETEVSVPNDAPPQQMLSAGDALVLRYANQLLIIDARTGKRTGTVTLVPEKK